MCLVRYEFLCCSPISFSFAVSEEAQCCGLRLYAEILTTFQSKSSIFLAQTYSSPIRVKFIGFRAVIAT